MINFPYHIILYPNLNPTLRKHYPSPQIIKSQLSLFSGVAKNKQKKAKQTLESSSLASTIEKDLQQEGYKKVDVDKADAEVTTVVENVPTLRSRQVITGVSIEQASDEAFQTAIQDAVAKATGMTSEDVQVTTHTATLPRPTHPPIPDPDCNSDICQHDAYRHVIKCYSRNRYLMPNVLSPFLFSFVFPLDCEHHGRALC